MSKTRGTAPPHPSGPPLDDAGRRSFVERMTQSTLALGCSMWFPAAFGAAPDTTRPEPGDVLVSADDQSGTKALTISDIPLASPPVIAFPLDRSKGVLRNGSRLNKVALIRLEVGSLDSDTLGRSAGGVLAFSAICTHQGCQVSQWLSTEQSLMCFCHFSKFSVRSNGEVIGGPAPRALPSLPLREHDGELVVAAPFSASPGASHDG